MASKVNYTKFKSISDCKKQLTTSPFTPSRPSFPVGVEQMTFD